MMRVDINACFGHWPYWDLPHKTAEDLVRLMDGNGIEKAAVLSLRGVLVDWRAGNDETLAAAGRHAGRLIPVATLSPFMDGDGDEVQRLADAGMRGVRLYPLFHSYPLDSEFTNDVCRAAAGRRIPVMIPTRPIMNWRFKTVAIESIGALATRHPSTTFIISGPNYLIEYRALVKVMKQCSNVHYEISCLQGFNSVANLVEQVGVDRVLFGTGAALNYPACNVAKLDHAELSPQQRETIAARNALRILGL
ncbi:MAG: amidohydrolase family protein [Phycisphaerae bacterium]